MKTFFPSFDLNKSTKSINKSMKVKNNSTAGGSSVLRWKFESQEIVIQILKGFLTYSKYSPLKLPSRITFEEKHDNSLLFKYLK